MAMFLRWCDYVFAPLQLRRLCKQHQTDEDGLASLFSVEKSELDATIRREVIFQGDLDCHREAKKASDGFEHGFLGFGDLRAIAARRRDQTAEYLRKAILDVAQCDDALRKKLLENTVAVGAWRLERYFRGLLVGEGDELAAPDQAYPIVRWRSSIARAALGQMKVDTLGKRNLPTFVARINS